MGMRSQISGAVTRTREVLQWLAEPRLFWIATLVVVAAVGLAVRPGATELEVRVIAAALQLLGVVQVAVGIRATRRLFGRPGIVEFIRDWWKRFPTGSKRIGVLAGHVNLGVSATAKLSATILHNKTAPLEDRVDRLEREHEILYDQVTKTREELARAAEEHREELAGEARMREEADAANRKLVEATQTGGLALSAAGVVWLILGIVLGSFPAEIAGWCDR